MSITVMRNGDLSRAAAPTPAARRQRRHRARRKQDLFVVPVEVTREMIASLVDQGDVDEANSTGLAMCQSGVALEQQRESACG